MDPRITPIGNLDPLCPYCEKALEKMPSRKRGCPQCGKPIFVYARPYDGKKALVTETQIEQIHEQLSILNGTHERYLAIRDKKIRAYRKAKADLTKQFGKPPAENDIQWRLLGEAATKHALAGDWALYRDVRFRAGEQLLKEKRFREALWFYLWSCFLDLNGPINIGSMRDIPEMLREYPPFNLRYAVDPPSALPRILGVIKKIVVTESEIRDLFLRVANQEYNKRLHPVSPNEAWVKIASALFSDRK